MLEIFSEYGNRIAISTDSEKMSYANIKIETIKICNYISNKYGTNNKFALCMRHGISYFIWALAVVMSGNKIYLLHPSAAHNTIDEIDKYVTCFLCDNTTIKSVTKFIESKDVIDASKLNLEEYSHFDYQDKSFIGSIILTTSGTTSGKSKYIDIPFNFIKIKSSLLSNYLKLLSSDTCYVFTPLCSIQALWSVLSHLYVGGKVHLGDFCPSKFSEILEKENITTLISTASIIRGMIDQLDDIFNLRMIVVGGDHIEPTLLSKLKEKWGHLNYANVYGTTETVAGDTVFEPRMLSELDDTYYSVGKGTIYSSIAIMDEVGNILSAYETGFICIQSPFLQVRNYNNHDKIINECNYFNTYDLGYLDSNGYLYYKGRASSIIIHNGFKVSPVEVENQIYSFEGVKEAVVIGRKHMIYGEIVVAYIVAKNVCTTEEIKEYLLQNLESYKIPKEIVFVKEFKYGKTGKIDRMSLINNDMSHFR